MSSTLDEGAEDGMRVSSGTTILGVTCVCISEEVSCVLGSYCCCGYKDVMLVEKSSKGGQV